MKYTNEMSEAIMKINDENLKILFFTISLYHHCMSFCLISIKSPGNLQKNPPTFQC